MLAKKATQCQPSPWRTHFPQDSSPNMHMHCNEVAQCFLSQKRPAFQIAQGFKGRRNLMAPSIPPLCLPAQIRTSPPFATFSHFRKVCFKVSPLQAIPCLDMEITNESHFLPGQHGPVINPPFFPAVKNKYLDCNWTRPRFNSHSPIPLLPPAS